MKASLDYYTDARSVRTRTASCASSRSRRYSINGRAHPRPRSRSRSTTFITRIEEGEVDQHVLRDRARDRAPVVGRAGAGRLRRAAADFLSESLANYSAMMVTEKILGPEAGPPRLRLPDGPLSQRARGSRARRSAARGRGPAVHLLRQGRRRDVHAARAHRRGGASTPRCAASSRSTATAGRRTRRRSICTPSCAPSRPTRCSTCSPTSSRRSRCGTSRPERAVVEPTGTGEYQVTLDVVAKKLRADSIGRETETPMNDLVEIGVFAPGEGDGLGAPLYLKRHRIRSGKQTIRITVPREPARAGIDP